jgi:hypothetical protein
MILFRPAILLHGALAAAAFFVALASAARWDGLAPFDPAGPPVASASPAPLPVYGDEALEHAEAVYRTRRYAEAEDALRCAGFRDVGPTRGSRVLLPGRDYEVVPHPAVRHAAHADLPLHASGAGLCAHLRQPGVQAWYRDRFPL